MPEQRFLVARNEGAAFRDEVQGLLSDGWRLVPGGLSIASAGYPGGDHWFGAVLERDVVPQELSGRALQVCRKLAEIGDALQGATYFAPSEALRREAQALVREAKALVRSEQSAGGEIAAELLTACREALRWYFGDPGDVRTDAHGPDERRVAALLRLTIAKAEGEESDRNGAWSHRAEGRSGEIAGEGRSRG